MHSTIVHWDLVVDEKCVVAQGILAARFTCIETHNMAAQGILAVGTIQQCSNHETLYYLSGLNSFLKADLSFVL